MKTRDKGFTLVELVVVIAIMSIIGIAIAGFIGVSTKQYRNVTKDVDIQYEAQLTMNQIGNLIIDAQKGVNFKDGSASAEGVALQTSTAAASDSMLIIYDEDCVYNVIFKPSENKLYLRKDIADAATGAVSEGTESLMAENVTGFSPCLDEAETKNSVELTIDFEKDGKSYTSTQNYTMRNKVPVGADVEFVPAEPDPISVRIFHDGIDVTGKSVAYEMKQGSNYLYFSSKVLGADAPSQDVTWSVSGNNSWANINPTGTQTAKLDFSEYETSKQLKVTVTSKEDPTKSASTTINIKSSVNMLECGNSYINSGSTIHTWINQNPTSYELTDFIWHIKVEQVLDDGTRIGRNDLLLYSETEIVSGGNIDFVNYHYTRWYNDPADVIRQVNVSAGNNLGSMKLEISIWLEVEDDPEFKSNTVVLRNYHI